MLFALLYLLFSYIPYSIRRRSWSISSSRPKRIQEENQKLLSDQSRLNSIAYQEDGLSEKNKRVYCHCDTRTGQIIIKKDLIGCNCIVEYGSKSLTDHYSIFAKDCSPTAIEKLVKTEILLNPNGLDVEKIRMKIEYILVHYGLIESIKWTNIYHQVIPERYNLYTIKYLIYMYIETLQQ